MPTIRYTGADINACCQQLNTHTESLTELLDYVKLKGGGAAEAYGRETGDESGEALQEKIDLLIKEGNDALDILRAMPGQVREAYERAMDTNHGIARTFR